MSSSPIAGLVVADRSRRVAFASGVGRDLRIHHLLADESWIVEAEQKRLTNLILDKTSYGIIVSPCDFGYLVLVLSLSSPVLDFVGSVDFAFDIIQHLVTDPFDAMTVVDATGRLVYISPVHETFFGLKRGEGNGQPVGQIIDNTGLDRVVKGGKPEIGAIQKMQGFERVVSRVPIRRDGQIVGAIGRVMFKGPQQVEAMSRRIKALENEVEFYRSKAAALQNGGYGIDDLIGQSPAMTRLRNEIVKVAPLEIPILIQGESGTGKELVAQSLHRLSPRRDEALVMINAAALPATLVESELFGYEAGSFTGADRKGRMGKFEQADGGTIFLDEIGEMPLDVQAKLLRVLQDRIVERVGGQKPREVDFRLVSATNRDLEALIADRTFRLDLYYRISPIVISVPPLRERVEDIGALVAHFLKDVAERHGRPEPEVEKSAIAYWMEQPWPGNARQLRHEVERAFVFAEHGRISADTVNRRKLTIPDKVDTSKLEKPQSQTGSIRDATARAQLSLVKEAMVRFNGNKKKTAAELGISRSYLYKLLVQISLESERT